jgi:hypothetical protein
MVRAFSRVSSKRAAVVIGSRFAVKKMTFQSTSMRAHSGKQCSVLLRLPGLWNGSSVQSNSLRISSMYKQSTSSFPKESVTEYESDYVDYLLRRRIWSV